MSTSLGIDKTFLDGCGLWWIKHTTEWASFSDAGNNNKATTGTLNGGRAEAGMGVWVGGWLDR